MQGVPGCLSRVFRRIPSAAANHFPERRRLSDRRGEPRRDGRRHREVHDGRGPRRDVLLVGIDLQHRRPRPGLHRGIHRDALQGGDAMDIPQKIFLKMFPSQYFYNSAPQLSHTYEEMKQFG